MARSLAALRVKIRQKPNGHADYPNFNLLPIVQASGLDWARWVDVNGSGWLYDSVGHDDDEPTAPASPHGMQWGVLLVPKQFALEAVALFPLLCARIDATQFQTFYDARIAKDEPDHEVNETILQRIKLKTDLAIALTQDEIDAKDPTNNKPGVRPNWRKNATRFMNKRSINIDDTL